jgi:hypothetical protein
MDLVHRVTIDYSADNDMLYAEGWEWVQRAENFVNLFELSLAEQLKDCVREDVGAVMIYRRRGQEAYWFDYENMWGGRYE